MLVSLSIDVLAISGDYKRRKSLIFNMLIFHFSKLSLFLLTLVVEDDSHDEAIDTQDTRHDNGYDRLEDQSWLKDTHAADTDTTLSSSVSCAQVYRQNTSIRNLPFGGEMLNLLQKTRAAAIPM